ncbi:MAG: RNA-binding protein [Deltaproteobacteria bacterium]|nr:RNA-binding protein [Deltaproteobacteria bacterium]MBW2305809.1 RNA-binding protein [Deltaproteobacteria bacterium]
MGKNLYVGNLPFSTEEDDLKGLFAEIGTVDSVKIVRERFSGKSRGFGFVEMATDELAEEAIKKLNGYSFDGRSLRVDKAKDKK